MFSQNLKTSGNSFTSSGVFVANRDDENQKKSPILYGSQGKEAELGEGMLMWTQIFLRKMILSELRKHDASSKFSLLKIKIR